MFIPGILISWATFPGVIAHEYAHKKACEMLGVRVYDVEYISGSGGGYVKHESTRNFRQTLGISAAPFVLNSLAAFILYSVAIMILSGQFVINEVDYGNQEGIMLLVAWLALSIGWHAIPSNQDIKNIWREATSKWRSSNLALYSLPLAVFFYIANLLEVFWFDAIYSMALGVMAYVLIFGPP